MRPNAPVMSDCPQFLYYRLGGLRIAERWFSMAPAPSDSADLEIIRRTSAPVPGWEAKSSCTLVSDLQVPLEELWASIDKDNRYEVRRAETKDAVQCELLSSPTAAQLREFLSFLEDFSEQKKLPSMTPRSLQAMERYHCAGRIVLSRVMREGHAIVWHSYYSEGACCRLLNSASLFRGMQKSADRALVGRANRLLHWRDLTHFKEAGVIAYDWGGWQPQPDEALDRINKFKESFGGAKAKVYDLRRPVSILGRVGFMAARVWQGRTAWLHLGRRRQIGTEISPSAPGPS